MSVGWTRQKGRNTIENPTNEARICSNSFWENITTLYIGNVATHHIMTRHPKLEALLLLLCLVGRNSSVTAYSTTGMSNRRVPSRHRMATLRSKNADDTDDCGLVEFSDRRRFFATAFAVGTIGLNPHDALGVDFMGKFSSAGNGNGMPSNGGVSKKVGGLANKIRGICLHMDELQRDLMQERWDLAQSYPQQLRSYVPIFTTYTDAAFPSDLPSDYGLRVALRYEVGRFFASLERLKRAISRKSLDEAYTAYADMSLHLDRYLRVGGLYTYYDSTIDNEPLFQPYNDALVYSDPIKDQAEVRDLVVLCKGPDKGRTGIVIGIYPDGNNNCVVKLDKFRGMREIRVVPRTWAAKRLGEQDPDDVFLIPRKGAKSS